MSYANLGLRRSQKGDLYHLPKRTSSWYLIRTTSIKPLCCDRRELQVYIYLSAIPSMAAYKNSKSCTHSFDVSALPFHLGACKHLSRTLLNRRYYTRTAVTSRTHSVRGTSTPEIWFVYLLAGEPKWQRNRFLGQSAPKFSIILSSLHIFMLSPTCLSAVFTINEG